MSTTTRAARSGDMHAVGGAAGGTPPSGAAGLRLLVLEDDPVIAHFIAAALAIWRPRIDLADDLAGARTLARADQHLWLFDARLPDGEAAMLLPELRARGLTVPAVALTADAGPVAQARLFAAGFAAVLAKPVAAAELRAALRPWLADIGVAAAPEGGRPAARAVRDADDGPAPAATDAAVDWDDRAAEAVVGDTESVRVLRRLFLDELPEQGRRLRAACQGGDVAGARARLHRLQASCSFVGAPALLRAVQALAAAPTDPQALAAFEARSQRLLGGP